MRTSERRTKETEFARESELKNYFKKKNSNSQYCLAGRSITAYKDNLPSFYSFLAMTEVYTLSKQVPIIWSPHLASALAEREYLK